jgi:hypothetical protein
MHAKAKEGQSGVVYADPYDPCLSDFSSVKPIKEVTPEDLRRANMEAFVAEIVKEEDAKIGAEATARAKKLAEKQEEKKELEDTLAKAKKDAAKSVEEAQQAASARLSQSTEAVVADVAKRARILGRQEQMERDQSIIKMFLEGQANASVNAARLARARALADDMKAAAQENVTTLLNDQSQASAQLVAEANQEASQAQQQMEEAYAKARADSMEAVQEASDHVSAVSNDIKQLQDAAKVS